MIGFELLKKLLNLDSERKIFFLKKVPLIIKIIKFVYNKFSIKILNQITQDVVKKSGLEIHSNSINEKKGLFRNVTLIEGFFQSYNLIDNIYNPLFNKSIYSNNKIIIPTKNTCFVHIRKGDYSDFKYNNCSVELDVSYYLEAIQYILNINPNLNFSFCTNAPHKYIKDNFTAIEDRYMILEDQGPNETFTYMTKCHYGIISNSTFSWMAGHFSNILNKNSLIVAPSNHLGHKFQFEIPEGILNPKFRYINYNP